MLRLLVAFVAVWWAYQAHLLLSSMPHPYEATTALDLSPEVLARVQSVPFLLESNEKLRGATKLFEGRVMGAESVAVTHDGTLLMLDRFGYLHRAIKDK